MQYIVFAMLAFCRWAFDWQKKEKKLLEWRSQGALIMIPVAVLLLTPGTDAPVIKANAPWNKGHDTTGFLRNPVAVIQHDSDRCV